MKSKSNKSKTASRSVRFEKLSVAERLELVERVFIRYPRLKNLHARIDFCRTYSKIAAEPECMLITGQQGAGKTTLIDWYAGEFEIRELPEKRVIPILVVTVPSPATVKGLATEMLEAIGDPAADQGTVSTITLRLRKFLTDCGVELIILDEFQHFDDRNSKGVLKTISDWLKNLLNKTKVPIVLVGMPGCESVLDAKGNEQLKRRFSNRERIEPFRWQGPNEIQEFRQLLKKIDDELPLLQDSHLADSTTAFLIHTATDGVITYVMKLLREAARMAIERGFELIDLSLLAQAYELRLAKEFPKRPNPFLPPPKTGHVTRSADRNRPTMGSTSKRVKARRRKPSMSDVLRLR